MIGINELFFPDNGYQTIACFCYALVFVSAYKRFDSLIMHYGAYDAPETARPWTTLLRYHAAAMIYACLYAIFFAAIYQLFHQHPKLIDAATSAVGADSAAGQFLSRIGGEDAKLISPILALIILTLCAEKYRKSASYDRRLRFFFQKLGSIPGAVSLTVHKLKKFEIDIDTDECAELLSEEMQHEIVQPVRQKDPKSLEYQYLRACFLFKKIERWNSIASDFFQFQVTYHQAFDNIKTRFEKLGANANRYYQLKAKCVGSTGACTQMGEEKATSRLNNLYPRLLTELRKDLKSDLKCLLENIYIFIACAVQTKGFSAKKRKKLIQSLGFKVDKTKPVSGKALDPNDLAMLAVFLVFVVPLSALLAQYAGQERLRAIHAVTYVVWSAMAIFIGLASVSVPIFIKQVRDVSDRFFWRWIRPEKGHPWCSYMVSGTLAAILGVAGMMALNFLNPHHAERSVSETLVRIVPWGLVPMSISLTLSFHLDRKLRNGRRNHILFIEPLTTALFPMLASVAALIINMGVVDMRELVGKMYFSLCSALLLGSVIGAIVPYRCRRQAETRTKVRTTQVDLRAVIVSCMANYAERAGREHVTIETRVSEEIPILTADPAMITHAINGLLSNALEFTPIEGHIAVAAERNNTGDLTLSFKDNGIGMSRHKIDNILDAAPGSLRSAWEQIDDNFYADLLQVRAIAEVHGGKMSIKSKQWEGTEVTITLPASIFAAESGTEDAAQPSLRPVATVMAA